MLETKKSIKDNATTLTPREGKHPLMESASWADDLNSPDHETQSTYG